jgi:hypothetical protein
MKLFSPTQALAAFTLLSLSSVRQYVGALQLDPKSPGAYALLVNPIRLSLTKLARIDQECFFASRETARCAICDP